LDGGQLHNLVAMFQETRVRLSSEVPLSERLDRGMLVFVHLGASEQIRILEYTVPPHSLLRPEPPDVNGWELVSTEILGNGLTDGGTKYRCTWRRKVEPTKVPLHD